MTNNNQTTIIAYCGLVCSKCGAFVKGKCKGCHSERPMFKNCPIKKCNMGNNFSTCADCKKFNDFKQCKKLNNFISKIMAFIFRSNGVRNLEKIREVGLDKFKEENK